MLGWAIDAGVGAGAGAGDETEGDDMVDCADSAPTIGWG
jgi:hypothetical protein